MSKDTSDNFACFDDLLLPLLLVIGDGVFALIGYSLSTSELDS